MAMNKSLDRTVWVVAVVGSLVAVNMIGMSFFGRIDLTRTRQFTLSRATLETLHTLREPLTVRAYFTADLPPPYGASARYVKDLLEEYYANGHGNFRFEFVDPESEETSVDKEKKKDVKADMFGRAVREPTSVERELTALGIPPVQVRVNADNKVELKRAYMGLVLMQGDKKAVIPVVSQTSGLEYDITSTLRKLTQDKDVHVAIVAGHGGIDVQKELGRLHSTLGQRYQVDVLDLAHQPEIMSDVDALLVVAPKTPFDESEKRAIDAYVSAGRAAAFLLSPIMVQLGTLESEEANSGLNDMLASYGVKVEPGMVMDTECATINMTQQRGFMRIQQPVEYPLVPMPKSIDASDPLTRGLSQVLLPFVSPLTLVLPTDGLVKANVLISSSVQSQVQEPPYNIDPFARHASSPTRGMHPLLVTLQGPIKSFYGVANSTATAAASPAATQGRIAVAGSAYFVTDQFLGKPNEALALNLIDWLVRDDALLAVRTRGLAEAPLRDLSDGQRNAVKYLNILGLPGAFIGFGLVRWRRRENRRSKVTL